jgi:hypothetical protein
MQPGLNYLRNAAENGYTYAFQQAFCIDRVVWKRLDLYVEYAFSVADDAHTEAVQVIDFGGVYQLQRNVSLDTSVEFGLNRASPTVAGTLGVSVRF